MFTVVIIVWLEWLWGLKEWLPQAKNKDLSNLVVELEAEAVVKIMQNKEEVVYDLPPLITDCISLLNQVGISTVSNVLREWNKCANTFTNIGQGEEWGTVTFDSPPNNLKDLLHADERNAWTQNLIGAFWLLLQRTKIKEWLKRRDFTSDLLDNFY